MSIDSIVDTGASCSIIRESIAKRLNCVFLPCSKYINGIGNGKIHISAIITVPVKFEDVCIELDLHVARDQDFPYELLIGRNVVSHPDIQITVDSEGCRLAWKELASAATIYLANDNPYHAFDELQSCIQNLDTNLQESIIKIFKKHPNVLPTPTHIGNVQTGQLHLRLKNGEVVNYRPYRLAPIERQKVSIIVKDLLDKKIIRESHSPFASPILLVKKKGGDDRLCIDYRSLNKLIEKDRYPLPLIEDQIDRLGNAKFFISIDMKNGFYQIPVALDSVKYTAFITPDGHYEFLKMPFGICNGPAVFQRAITKAVQHLKFLLTYIDDLLIPFTSIEEGLSYLELTIEALSIAGFTINLSKCKFFVNEIQYLGRLISKEGVRPSNDKVLALVNSPTPRTVKQVRQFMGLASYFRKFIPEFAFRTACITQLTSNNQKWEWGYKQEAARNYVIQCLTSKPLLSIYNPDLPTELHTDASSLGYGAILLQKDNNNVNKVVAYFSKRTSSIESRYSSYDLETLAIYNSLKQFRVYLLGIKFKIITDCNAIKSTANKKDLSPRVARWWTYLQDFDFEIVYRKGKYISHVDFLSRNPVEVTIPTTPACSFHSVNLISNDSRSWLEIAQQNDPETLSLIQRAEVGDLDENQYVVLNNLLYYKADPNASPKLFVPRNNRIPLLRLFHDENCHVGFYKTLDKIRENFWFPSMAAFVKKYLYHCLICVERKGHTGPKEGLLHPIYKSAVPFHTIHLDCTGPFPQSTDGYKYILLIIDGFTKFCILKKLKTLGADELVPVIRDTITLFGTPSLVVTDRGTNFSSNLVRSLFRDLEIEHHMIATGTPRGNGQAERYVSTVINMLTTRCGNVSDWPNEVWKVQQSINTTIQKSTGFSPIRLLVGSNANIPCVQARLNEIYGVHAAQQDYDVLADRELAHNRLRVVAQKFKERFDTVRRQKKTYHVGDIVYVYQDHRRHEKLKPKFRGPYEIHEILNNDRYSLRGRGQRNLIISKDKLRFWPGEMVYENATVEDAI